MRLLLVIAFADCPQDALFAMENQVDGVTSTGNNRKRGRDVSPSPAGTSPLLSCRQQAQDALVALKTPRRSKRVRFSDPGPVIDHELSNGNTGLTPAISRTSMSEDRAYSDCQTPSDRRRRRSAPPRHTNLMFDPLLSSFKSDLPTYVQFTPLRQVVEPRTRRRLWRSGLSDEMNKIERENRETKKEEAHVQSLQKESANDEAAQYVSTTGLEDCGTMDTMMVDEPSMSTSPIFRSHNDRCYSDVPNATHPSMQHTSSQVSIVDHDAVATLDSTLIELSNIGFFGSTIDEILNDLRTCFRSARMDLERTFPGETASDLNDGKATLLALTSRLRQVANALVSEKSKAQGALNMHRALKNEFDTLLQKLELEQGRLVTLKEAHNELTGDMLLTRQIVLQRENQIRHQQTTISRHIDANKKLQQDNDRYLSIVSQLEQALETSRDSQEAEETIAQLRFELEAKDTEIEKYVSQIESLRGEVSMYLEERCRHLKQLETLSSEISDGKNNIEKMKALNTGLQAQYDEEVESRENLEQIFSNILHRGLSSLRNEKRKSKARTTNWQNSSSDIAEPKNTADSSPGSELPTPYRNNDKAKRVDWRLSPTAEMSDDNDDTNSNLGLPGSEPSTPSKRYSLGNIRVGRGKDRRSLDSGVGFWSADLSEEVDNPIHGQKEFTEPVVESGVVDVE
ncbi:hypothetical protein BGW36DRAFT_137271 [Talaromyces proteolyticus]|uniref:Uncharacterized protein n=1 Tax=Talaromyces proteolyticus TaxID=1131652 RepID=A0AAD4Q0I2_9EURO|nr:uncharacterized protein BGW36DRAFT_137271 [Talaromyces proteolyticus]KAH8700849.1 hypothetical protein BGW36DRAFT_137271 [Talaromyces proteolyticus]